MNTIFDDSWVALKKVWIKMFFCLWKLCGNGFCFAYFVCPHFGGCIYPATWGPLVTTSPLCLQAVTGRRAGCWEGKKEFRRELQRRKTNIWFARRDAVLDVGGRELRKRSLWKCLISRILSNHATVSSGWVWFINNQIRIQIPCCFRLKNCWDS